MIIRTLTLNDFDAVNDIFMQLHNLHVKNRPDIYRRIEKPTTKKAWGYEASLEDENKIMLGAELDGKIVGFATVSIRTSESKAFVPHLFAFIDEIAVDSNYRRKGVGKTLYENCIKQAKRRGATSIVLKVWSFNVEAIAFYKSLGMTVQHITMEQNI